MLESFCEPRTTTRRLTEAMCLFAGSRKQEVKPRDLSHVERNLDTLLTTLAEKCQKMFETASRTISRTAELAAGPPLPAPTPTEDADSSAPQSAASGGSPKSKPVPLMIRERTVPDESKGSDYEFTTCRRSLADQTCSRTTFSNTLQSGRRMTVGDPTVSPGSPLLSTCAVPR